MVFHASQSRLQLAHRPNRCVWLVAISSSLFLPLTSPIAFADNAIESLLDPETSLWNTAPDKFIERYAEHGFEWTSAEHDVARAYKTKLRFLGKSVLEAKLRFVNTTPTMLSLSLYNRGDAGNLNEASFSKIYQDIRARLDNWTKRRSINRRQKKDSRSRKRSEQWRTNDHDIALLGSYSTKDADGRPTFRAEYIRVDIKPKHQNRSTHANPRRPQKAVKQEDGGVRLENVPMVDQGDKGYCAVATAERVFRYYGFSVDQHELAQLASSSSEKGTNTQAMVATLKKTGIKLGWRVKVLTAFEWGQYLKIIRQYNQLAKRHDQPIIDLDAYNTISAIYKEMDFRLLKKVRLKSARDFRNFQLTVAKYVNRGMPLAWSVITGKVPENPKISIVGGHMRLIIGYHPKESLIYYSDSWGAGHELKQMRADDAWTITTGLYSFEPK